MNDFATLPPHMIETFMGYPESLRPHLLALRSLIIKTANQNPIIGPLEETLKWSEASYLATTSKAGSTLRIGPIKNSQEEYAIFVNCKTKLVAYISKKYPQLFRYQGNRAIILNIKNQYNEEALRDVITIILTYHISDIKESVL